jgi:hypothetical protein
VARGRQDGHSSRPRIAARLKRPTRSFHPRAEAVRGLAVTRRAARAGIAPGLAPYLVLLRVGFAMPCPLLDRRCALTAPFHPYSSANAPGRYVFCGTFRRLDLNPDSRTLSGTLLCGVRTFLPVTAQPGQAQRSRDRATVRSGCQLFHYRRCSAGSRCGNECRIRHGGPRWRRGFVYLLNGLRTMFSGGFRASTSGGPLWFETLSTANTRTRANSELPKANSQS